MWQQHGCFGLAQLTQRCGFHSQALRGEQPTRSGTPSCSGKRVGSDETHPHTSLAQPRRRFRGPASDGQAGHWRVLRMRAPLPTQHVGAHSRHSAHGFTRRRVLHDALCTLPLVC